MDIKDLERKCEGCGKTNGKRHALSCMNGGLIITRHNEVRDELSHICRKAFHRVWIEPKIHATSFDNPYITN